MNNTQSYDEFLQRLSPARQKTSLFRFILIFGAVYFLLQWGYQDLADTQAYHFYIDKLVTQPGAFLIHLLVPADDVVSHGNRLIWESGRLNVQNGCDGAEVIELLIAAFAAVGGTWRMKTSGMAIGLGLIYLLNETRLAALYFAIRHNRTLFELVHGVIGPLVIIAVVTLFFAWWITPREPKIIA